MKFDATILPDQLDTIPILSKDMEDQGFAGLWVPETSHNPFLPLTLAASQTSRLELGTAIALAFPRSPMTTAHVAWDLASQSNGRFILGLGTQIKAHITKRFGMEWSKPGPRLREYILALRAIWNCWGKGERLDFRGEFYRHTLMTPFFTPPPIDNPDIPIYIAGVNQYLCRLAGEMCHGFHVHPFHTPDYLHEVILTHISEGAAKAGRSRTDITTACAIFVVTGANAAEIEQDKINVKTQIAFYASTHSYRPVLEHHGWGDLQDQLSLIARRGAWQEMHKTISDDMLEKIAVVAPYDDLAHKVKERYTGLLDRVAYYLPYQPGERDAMWQRSLATFNA